jgi:hypothetical protein
MAMTAEATRNGFTPMSIRRVIEEGASFGVEGAEDQVAGQGRLDGDVGRLAVADLAHQDDVGGLAHHGAQDPLKVRPISWRTSAWLIPARLYSMGSRR